MPHTATNSSHAATKSPHSTVKMEDLLPQPKTQCGKINRIFLKNRLFLARVNPSGSRVIQRGDGWRGKLTYIENVE